MGFVFDNYTVELVLGSITLAYLFYYLWTWKYDYWKSRGIPCLEPTFPFGNTYALILQTQFIGEVFKDIYFKLQGHKLGGIINLRNPHVVLRDPEVIKNVMTKDFNSFMDRGVTADFESEPILEHLFNMRGEPWRNLRMKLTPTFTSGKMKMMFHIMKACADHLGESLETICERGEALELKDHMSRFGMDVIGSCAFGLDIGAINAPDNDFRKYLTLIFKQPYRVLIRNFLNQLVPGLGKTLGVRSFSKEGTEFFFDFVRRNIEYREKNNIERNDFLDLLIQIKNKGKVDGEEEEADGTAAKSDENGVGKANGGANGLHERAKKEVYLSDELLTAQCFVFFIAGFETSSTTLSFCLHELAINKDIQRKLQKEIETVLRKHNGKVSYEALKEMTYMDRCVSEALRKYPPIATLIRECVKDYKVPDTDFVIEKKMRVIIPLYGIHYDPEFYPDPYKFDPERFTEEAKQSRHHYTWLPFGEGPRVCIGLRFGLMQVKMGLVTVLSKYNVDLPPDVKLPLEFDNKTFVTASKTGIKLKISKRNSSI